MKKLLVLILAIAVLAGLYIYTTRDTGEAPKLQTNNQASDGFRPDPSSATFAFNEGPVTLSGGRSERLVGRIAEETILSDVRAFGDLNLDGRDDAAVVLLQSAGGSGIFIYVAGFVSGQTYKGTNAIYIGDRIEPQEIEIENGVITFTYLDREEDEPFAAEPTVRTTKQFVYRSGKLEER